MSSEHSKKSNAAGGREENDSVYDFLYHDPLRIASFLGQFDPSGVQQSLKRTDNVSRGKSDQSNDRLSVNLGVVNAALGERIGATEGTTHGAERTFDPLWANARAFLDYITTHNLLVRDLAEARFGQFVLSTGSLSIADLTLIREAWKLPSLRKSFGVDDSDKKYKNASAKVDPEAENAKVGLEMISIMPHSVQATIRSASDSVWANLKPDCLATEPADLTLKHGFNIPGEWSVLGILDGSPYDTADAIPSFAGGEQAISLIFQSLAPITRNIMGRPADAYSVTPLLVFREVAARS